MACFSPLNGITALFVVILCCVQISYQQNDCEQLRTSLRMSIQEDPSTLGKVLYNAVLSSLRLQGTNGGYLAIKKTDVGGGLSNFTLYIAKEIDYEERQTSISDRIFCKNAANGPVLDYGVTIGISQHNEFAPEFTGDLPYVVNVREDTEIGTVIFTVSGRDRDVTPTTTRLRFDIVNDAHPFGINKDKIFVNGTLDFEEEPNEYTLNISATEILIDGFTNYTTLTISVTDVDDVGPYFTHNATYTLSIPEGDYNATGKLFDTVPRISARDGDALGEEVNIILDQTSSSLASMFNVSTDRKIKVTGTVTPGEFTLNIRAYQTKRPADRFAIASVAVTVYDVNNNAPAMSTSSYSGRVLEGAVNGTVVVTVSAVDHDKGDNSRFRFHMSETNVPFSIVTTDHNFGIIQVSGPVNREDRDSYLLHVFAMEDKTQEHYNSSVSEVHITVIDANDNSPEFEKRFYTFLVNETDTVGRVVGQVKATDSDEGDNGKVTYSIVNNDQGVVSAFRVNKTTGIISLSRDLTQNDTGDINLELRAEDSPSNGQQKRSYTVQVTVKILAVNEFSPKFSQNSYYFTVQETAPEHFSVGGISATDKDGDPLVYTFGNTPTGFPFRLSGNPPRLEVTGSLDLDNRHGGMSNSPPDVYSFNVEVTDGTHVDVAAVTVNVSTVNEHQPVMAKEVYRKTVPENATSGSTIVKIQATDEDTGPDGQVRYSITSPTDGLFALDAVSGDLTLNCTDCLDFSVKRLYVLVVKATDRGNPDRFTYATVIISVQDVNNKSPHFRNPVVTGSVEENAPNETVVIQQLQAIDDDTDSSLLVFSLENLSPPGWLAVKDQSLVTNGNLDAEFCQVVTGTLKVSDGAHEAVATLNVSVLDKNDNSPQILLQSDTVSIPENARVGDQVLTFTARDSDVMQSSFLFYLSAPNSGKFDVNYTGSVGEITVAAPFDRRIQTNYSVTISVSDNSAPPKMNSTTVHVIITDSNSAPTFVNTSSNMTVDEYTFSVSETEEAGFVVGRVRATDPDAGSSGEVRYVLQGTKDLDQFSLNSITGELSLREKLDFEEKSSYSLTVNATDNSFEPRSDIATITVTVLDVVEAPRWPDPLPVISLTTNQMCSDVQVDARPQDLLTTSTATQSGNSGVAIEVVYSLLNNTDSFSINNETGQLRRIGALQPREYHMGLRACSTLNTSVCSDAVLTIQVTAGDVITFCPPFLLVNVTENAKMGVELVDLDSTKGDTDITYSLIDGRQLPFAVNATTGVVTVDGQLDREKTPLYILRVAAVLRSPDGSATAQVTVVLNDDLDSPPRFQQPTYMGRISEAAAAGQPVLTLGTRQPLVVQAEDGDVNPVLTYTIEANDDQSSGAFAVNSTTGEITLSRSIDLETMPPRLNGRYSFKVTVSDSVYNDSTTVTVEVMNDNDNDPVFQPDVLNVTISEDVVVPYVVVTVHATDGDDGDTDTLVYTLSPSSVAGSVPFSVSRTGELKLDSGLDRETQDSYTFAIVAKDTGGKNGTLQVNIVVGDANEHPAFLNSTYVFDVVEGPDGIGSEMLVSAADGDLGNNAGLTFAIQSGNQNGAFDITTYSNSTAVIRVIGELDREQSPTVTLIAIVTDNGQPPLAATSTVEITVTDVNDNSPVFGSSNGYTAEVNEGAINNTRLQISPALYVTDTDDGVLGRLGVVFSLYHLPDSQPAPFRVDRSGDLFVSLYNDTDQLDREITSVYSLTLVATDDNGAGLNGTTTVVVTISNVNDQPPYFLRSHYDIDITENMAVGSLVTTFIANDSDTDPSLLRFELYRSGIGDKFYLNPFSGELRVSGLLDRETQGQYMLNLGVSDGTFKRNATATITLGDENDNCPEFTSSSSINLTVIENQDPTFIHHFHATDRDLGSNGNVTFFINDTAASIYVDLSSNGELRTTQKLDREKHDQQSLTFTVWAQDGGSPPCVTSRRVRVEVLGDNEQTPTVCQITPEQRPVCDEDITVTAFTQSPQGTFLAALTWVDHDIGQDGKAKLSLTLDPDGLLSLNQSSSTTFILVLARALDVDDLRARNILGDDNATYTAEVTATDRGRPPKNSSVVLRLIVQDLLPTTPVFSRSVYNFSIAENQGATVIGSVLASTERDQLHINYTMEVSADFTVNGQGEVSTLRSLDREKTDSYAFLILASVSPPPSDTATAVILVSVQDENDNVPEFFPTDYEVRVEENLPDRDLVKLVASDDDAAENGMITFTLVNDTLGSLFSLDSQSGQLHLNQSLDYETISSYTLLIQAADGGVPSESATATVRITVEDRNDNTPKFTQSSYTGYLDENSPALTPVLNVSATDLDSGLNGRVLYDLQSLGSAEPAFYVNELSGALYTSRSMSYRDAQRFDLTVLAHDLGTPPRTTKVNVVILINDLSKVLPKVTVVPEAVALVLGTPAGSQVPVNVSGGFGNWTFVIRDGNEDGVFAMDEDNGQLSVTSELSETKEYQLTIRVTNEMEPEYWAEKQLRVTVTTVKLEQERYAAVLPENKPPTFLLLDISSNAERSGIPVTYTLIEEIPSGAFMIVADNGKVYCNKSLDREHKAMYTMRVSVQLTHALSHSRKKRALSSVAEIVVIVDDVNDNPPRFTHQSQIFGIPSLAPAYTVVTTLKATDPDFGSNGALVYKATGGDIGAFSVTSDGKVTSLVKMPKTKNQHYRLMVNATDNGGSGLSTKLEMKIVVVATGDRFGLVANVTVGAFTEKQEFYLRRLSEILNMTLQVDKVGPHQGNGIDTSKSDIYFYAFDGNGKPIPFAEIDKQVKSNTAAISALFGGKHVDVIPVTDTPVKIRVQTAYAMGEAEIAIIVVACLIFLGSFVAILLTFRAWKKQKAFQKREDAAVRARQRLEQETRDLADKIQETSFVADPDEPLELDMDPEDEGRIFNPRMFLKKMSDEEHREPRAVKMEDQEFTITFGNENPGLDTVALRRVVLRRTEEAMLEGLLETPGEAEEGGDGGVPLLDNEADSGTDQHPGEENNEDSASSGDHHSDRVPPSPPDNESGSPAAATVAAAAGDGSGTGGESSADPYPNLSTGRTSHIHDTIPEQHSSQKSVSAGDGIESSSMLEKSPSSSSAEGGAQGVTKSSTEEPRSLLNGNAATVLKTDDKGQLSELGSQANNTGALPVSSSSSSPAYVNTMELADTEGKSDDTDDHGAPEDLEPAPDYQKRVSFSEVLDIDDGHDDNAGAAEPKNYLNATAKLLAEVRTSARKPQGFVNPAFETEGDDGEKKDGDEKEEHVVDGWAEDYDSHYVNVENLSTAL